MFLIFKCFIIVFIIQNIYLILGWLFFGIGFIFVLSYEGGVKWLGNLAQNSLYAIVLLATIIFLYYRLKTSTLGNRNLIFLVISIITIGIGELLLGNYSAISYGINSLLITAGKDNTKIYDVNIEKDPLQTNEIKVSYIFNAGSTGKYFIGASLIDSNGWGDFDVICDIRGKPFNSLDTFNKNQPIKDTIICTQEDTYRSKYCSSIKNKKTQFCIIGGNHHKKSIYLASSIKITVTAIQDSPWDEIVRVYGFEKKIPLK